MVGSINDIDDCGCVGEVASPIWSDRNCQEEMRRLINFMIVPNARLTTEVPYLELYVLVLDNIVLESGS